MWVGELSLAWPLSDNPSEMVYRLDTAHKTQPKIRSPTEPGFCPRVNRFSIPKWQNECCRETLSRQGLLPRSYYMSTSTDTARARAEAQFKKKEQQARDGEQATAEYDAQQQTIREKTAQLRGLRLARDAARQTFLPAKNTAG